MAPTRIEIYHHAPPTHTQKNNVEGMDKKSRLLTKSDQKHFPKLLTLESDQNFFQNY